MRYTLLILVIALFASCSDNEQTNYIEENDNDIIEYLKTNKLDATKSSTGLYYIIEEPGTGVQASANSFINLVYTGYLINGQEFSKSNSNGIFTSFQQELKGLTEGISHFKEGGSGKLLIPAHLAYGNSSNGTIPGGSVLIFDIQLIEVYDDFENCLDAIKIKNEKEITSYITENGINAQKTESGLYYVIEKEGTGAQAKASSNVTVAYKGYFTDGSGFDQSKDDGISFYLNEVIKGWTEGIPYFKEGGKGKLLIPSHLAYGPYGNSRVPGGAVLIFDINLIEVK